VASSRACCAAAGELGPSDAEVAPDGADGRGDIRDADAPEDAREARDRTDRASDGDVGGEAEEGAEATPADDGPSSDGSADDAADACEAGLSPCESACVALDSDPENCATCGHACPRGPHSAATCVAAACGLACDDGFGDCDGAPATGCKADLPGDVANRGSCGHPCASPHATASCAGGRCSFSREAGFAALGDRCAAFGGAFQTNDCGACEVGDVGSVCLVANPVTGGCSCPAGTSRLFLRGVFWHGPAGDEGHWGTQIYLCAG
jgi:hypothetical protein